MSEPDTFAVVIPTYNEERNIGRLLRSIRMQTDTSCSIVVVDQSSADRTVEVARSFGCKVIEIPGPSFYSPPARSRNVGAHSVDSRILLHLDADMELASADFLRTLESLIDNSHSAAVIYEIDVASGFWAKCKALERSCYQDSEMESARAVTRDLFFTVGGYDEDVSSGEDFYITRLFRQRTRIARDPSLLLRHHVGRGSLRSMLRKKFDYGRTAKTYLHKARRVGAQSGPSIAWSSARAYLRNWPLLAKQPAHYLCIFPLRAMELAAVWLGMWFGPKPKASQAPDEPRSSPAEGHGH